MTPGLVSMKLLSNDVTLAFTVPSTFSTSTGYRHGATGAPVQDPVSGPVVVVSSAIRRFAFCQYEPPVEGQPVIHGTHIFFGEGTEMFLIPVTIRAPSVLNEFISLAPIWRRSEERRVGDARVDRWCRYTLRLNRAGP